MHTNSLQVKSTQKDSEGRMVFITTCGRTLVQTEKRDTNKELIEQLIASGKYIAEKGKTSHYYVRLAATIWDNTKYPVYEKYDRTTGNWMSLVACYNQAGDLIQVFPVENFTAWIETNDIELCSWEDYIALIEKK